MNKGGRRLIELTQIHVKMPKNNLKATWVRTGRNISRHAIPGGDGVRLTRKPTQKTGAELSLEKRAML